MNSCCKNIAAFFLITLLFIASNDGIAQAKKIRPLTIGDQVPDIEFNMMNYQSPTARLSDFKGKLVIIDFWASWCWSCLHALPKMDKLQKQYGDKIQVIAVNSIAMTGDDSKKVNFILGKYKDTSAFSLPVSYNDSVAGKLFPSYSLPHYVWISQSGEVKAITDASAIKKKNIDAILQNETVDLDLPVKKDYFPNRLLDLSIDGVQPEIDDNLAYYSIFKKGKIDKLSSINSVHTVPVKDDITTQVRGISARNVTLIQLFEAANRYQEKRVEGVFNKRVLIKTRDKSTLPFIYDSTKTTKEEWEKENLYTYDLAIPASEEKNIGKLFWRDINLYSGYNVSIEAPYLNCYALVVIDTAKVNLLKPAMSGSSISTRDGVCEIQHCSPWALVQVLDNHPKIYFPVISKVSKNVQFEFQFDYDHFDIKKLNEQLRPFGMALKNSLEQINSFVVTDKPADQLSKN